MSEYGLDDLETFAGEILGRCERAMAQVVAEEFGLPLDDIHIHTGDSKSVGYSDGAAGSRVARTMPWFISVSSLCSNECARRSYASPVPRTRSSHTPCSREGCEFRVQMGHWNHKLPVSF